MPVYDYYCADCEYEFSELLPLERHRDPLPCPLCHGMADRVIGAPRLNIMRSEMRKAHQVNERAAHEPRMSAPHRCHAGCDHGRKNRVRGSGKAKRPWMLGH